MSFKVQTEIDALHAPAGDGEVLCWPESPRLTALAAANRVLRNKYEFELLGRPAREWIAANLAGPLSIATGHQPSFFHAGVWIKSVAAGLLARAVDGHAEFIVVDNDTVQQSLVSWPAIANGHVRIESELPFEGSQDRPFELSQGPLTPISRWQDIFSRLTRSADATKFSPAPEFVSSFLEDPSRGYLGCWTAGMKAIDRIVQTDSSSPRCVSSLFSLRDGHASSVGTAFTAHLILNAAELTKSYNAALASYRNRRGIRGSRHPVPDLAIQDDRYELPLWLLHPSYPRMRLAVSRETNGRIILWADDMIAARLDEQPLKSDPALALSESLGEWRIRPRALALTLFLRLFACDLFIHGIGGAKYDQITDDLVRRFFNVEPPPYVCLSATLRLPLPTFDVGNLDMERLNRRGRDLRFNPQRFLPDPTVHHEAPHLLKERSTAIAESEILRKIDQSNRAARRRAFDRIHTANEAIRSELLRRTTLPSEEELLSKLASNEAARSREWFFALHSTARLGALRDRLRELVS